MTGTLYAGTSGLVFTDLTNRPSRTIPHHTRLTYYAHKFNSLEINSSFYKIPLPATFEKWTRETPEDFQFTVKLWQGITHHKNLAYAPEDLRSFMNAANRLGEKKGCLLIQFPPSLTSQHASRLDQLLLQIQTSHHNPHTQPAGQPTPTQPPSDKPWRLAVEFRHPSWYTPETWQTLHNHAAALVLHDMPSSSIQTLPPSHPPFVYLRFHGPLGDYKGGYPLSTLDHYARKIRHWLAAQHDVYVYFNNTIGDAIPNCKALVELTSN